MLVNYTWLSLLVAQKQENIPLQIAQPNSLLTPSQQKRIETLLSSEFADKSKTFKLQDIDSLWYNQPTWTLNLLKSLVKKGFISQVLWKTSYTSYRFEIRYHIPEYPLSSNIDAIRTNRAYYEAVDSSLNLYSKMLSSSDRPLSTKQEEILKILSHNFPKGVFTRKQINALYWETVKKPNANVNTFAHQLLLLVAKGKIATIDGSHLTGPYRLVGNLTSKEIHTKIYNATLGRLTASKSDPWSSII